MRLRILHRRSTHEEPVAKKLLAAVRDLKGMVIERNWSERRAAVTDVNGAIKCLVLVACPAMMEYIEPFPAPEEIAKALEEECQEKRLVEEPMVVAAPAKAAAKRVPAHPVVTEASLLPPPPPAAAQDGADAAEDEDLYEGK